MMIRSHRALYALVIAVLVGIVSGCGDDCDTPPVQGNEARFETTRLCAIVPARDPAAAAFPPTPPVRAFGTDLGFSYERDGLITILFGDTWQRIDICPIQLNDDSLATMEIPADDWPGFTARQSLPDAQCPELTFPLDEAGTSFAPIDLRRWDGVVVPLGPLNTPIAAFHDGQAEWSIFLVAGGQACSPDDAACPTDLSAQAADLVCGTVADAPLCVDPTSTKSNDGQQAYYLHVAERVGPAAYVSRAMFLTNKYLNLTARAVRAFDPDDARRRDYETGTSALLMWGRPGFEEQSRDGKAPPYFMYHRLPFERAGDQIVFRPHYYRGASDGAPRFSGSQADAVPLYTDEFEPVNQASVSWIPSLRRWLMIYGGNVVDFVNLDGNAGASQPVPGALYARHAPEPWGPWTEPTPVLTEEHVAQDMVCGKRAPAGCVPPPDPLIRPDCLELVDPRGGGTLYGAAIIDALTRPAGGRAADVFWLVSTWHPYSVVLIRTRMEIL
jgi:hypothetical protein